MRRASCVFVRSLLPIRYSLLPLLPTTSNSPPTLLYSPHANNSSRNRRRALAEIKGDLSRCLLAGGAESLAVETPPDLEGRYQSYTQADLSALRGAGYTAPFMNVEQGVRGYCDHLLQGER